MSAQPTGVRKPDRWQVRVSGLTSVVGPPQGGRAGIAAGSEATEAVRKAEASLWTPQRSGGCQQSCPPGANGQGRWYGRRLRRTYDRHLFVFWQRSRKRSSRGARSSLSQLATGQTGMSAGRNLMEWKSRRRDVPERLEPSLSDGASAEKEGLDRLKSNAVQIDIIACCP